MFSKRPTPLRALAAALVPAMALWSLGACAWTPRLAGIVHQDSRGAVYLEENPDLAFSASHPVLVDQRTVARLLGGIHVQRPLGESKQAVNAEPHATPAFSRDDIAFLGPLIATALSKARPEHHVVFRSLETSPTEPRLTAGVLYVHDNTIYVTITHFESPAGGAEAVKASSPLPQSSRMARYGFYFVPETIGRPALRLPPGAPDWPTLTPLAVSLEALTRLAAPPNQRVAGPRRTLAAQGSGSKDQPAEPAPEVDLEAVTQAGEAYRVKLRELQEANRILGQRMAEEQALREDLRIIKERLAEHRKLIEQLKAHTMKMKKTMKKKMKKASAR